MAKKPVPIAGSTKASWPVPPTSVGAGRRPVPGNERGRSGDMWCLSFRYWTQQDFFGLDGKSASWFVSLLERFRDISREPLSRIQTDGNFQRSIHYHTVNWGQNNIPINRRDLTALPRDIRENENDYPIYQFSVSLALGRIAGFWDGCIFNVVLLDPYHNLQPAKEFNYRVTPTTAILSEHELLVAKLELIKHAHTNCSTGDCSTQKALKDIEWYNQPFGILYLDAEYFNMAKNPVQQGKFGSVKEFIELKIIEASS